MQLNNPKKLKKGDTIGVVAPSSGLAGLFPHRTENGKKMLEKLGFNVVFSKHSKKINGWVSASAKERADDINEMFEDKNIDAILCTIGGNHANQILKYIDFDLVKNNPKIFIGYSDITILHYAFASKSNLRTFYGPCLVSELGEYPEILPYTTEYFEKALMKNIPIGKIIPSENWTDEFLDWFNKEDLKRPRKLEKNFGYDWWKEGKTTAPIWGGTIPTINHLAGSEYWVDLKDKILFLDIPEGDNPGEAYSQSWLDSYLADLDNLNVFSLIKGLVVGRPYGYSEEDEKKLKEMLLYYIDKYDYPVLFNADIGHTAPMITIPMGARVTLNSEDNIFSINEKGVK